MKKYLILILICFFAGYCSLYISTENLLDDFKDIVTNQRQEGISYDQLERYALPTFVYDNISYDSVNIKVRRLFVLHNFRKGIVWVKYSYIAYDKEGNILAGTNNILSKWYIEKKNGRWKVVKIEEKP